jgi:hypothetical protein
LRAKAARTFCNLIQIKDATVIAVAQAGAKEL